MLRGLGAGRRGLAAALLLVVACGNDTIGQHQATPGVESRVSPDSGQGGTRAKPTDAIGGKPSSEAQGGTGAAPPDSSADGGAESSDSAKPDPIEQDPENEARVQSALSDEVDPAVKYWFNESGTLPSESSGNRDAATLENGASLIAGARGNAVRIAGGTQRVALPAGLVKDCEDVTVALRVKLSTNSANWARIFDFGSDTSKNMFLTPRAGARNALRFAITTGGGRGEQQLNYAYNFPTNTWKHLAVVLSKDTGTMYLDGVEVAKNTSMTLNPSALGETANNWLGDSQRTADPTLDGAIDDVIVSCRAYSATEVAWLASGIGPGFAQSSGLFNARQQAAAGTDETEGGALRSSDTGGKRDSGGSNEATNPKGESLGAGGEAHPSGEPEVLELPPGWTPEDLNPVAWYFADPNDIVVNGGVEWWHGHQQIGPSLGNTFQPGRPQFDALGWNGNQPTVRFNGGSLLRYDAWSAAPVGTNAAFTVLAVMRSTIPQNATDNGIQSGIATWWSASGDMAWASVRSTCGLTLLDFHSLDDGNNTQMHSGDRDLGIDVPHVVAWRYSPSARTVTLTVDGAHSTSSLQPTLGNLTQMPLIVGATSLLPTGMFRGDISELVIVGDAISDEEVQNFTEYAQNTWGLPTPSGAGPCVKANGAASPATTRCDDGNPDTVGDHCSSGTCVGAVPVPGSPKEFSPYAWYYAAPEDVVLTGGFVSTWYDRGSGRQDLLNGYVGRPNLVENGWNGNKRTVTFAGGHNVRRHGWTGTPTGTEEPFTVLAVMRSSASQDSGLAGWWAPNSSRLVTQIKTAGTATVLGLFRQDGVTYANQQFTGDIALGTTPHAAAWRYAGGIMKLTVDGVTRTLPQSPIGTISPDLFFLGSDNPFWGLFRGDISEFAIIPRSITDTELARFNDYAQGEWGGLTLCIPDCVGKPQGADNECGGTCDGPGAPGDACTPTSPCQQGLECTNGMCSCPAGAPCSPLCPCGPGGGPCTNDDVCEPELSCVDGTCICVPQCDGETCGGDDGCGGVCGCGDNQVCLRNSCVIQDCLSMPLIFGCGFPGATCGESCTDNPTCTSDQDCPTGLVCPAVSNGWRYGVPGQRICERTDCTPEDCGSINSPCGLCDPVPDCAGKSCGDADLSDGIGGRCPAVCDDGEAGCQMDSDCQAGSLCLSGVCRPADPCASPNLAPPDCGPGTLCGPCATPPAVVACLNRECGTDPVTQQSCGQCGAGFFCNGAGQCALLESTPAIAVPVPGGGTRTVTPPPAPGAPEVGAIPAAFNVTDRGSAQYTIPIEVPPGRFIEPALALRYTSSTGNGALGVGWSLDGLSTITACQRTFAQDGYAQPVNGTDNDQLCLDGQRLVLVGGEHFKCGAEYRTAVDTFDRIRIDTTANDSCSPILRVYKKDGRIFTYRGGLNRTSWPLTRVEDRSGNFMRITYWQPTFNATNVQPTSAEEVTEELPLAITYTGFGNTDGDREILFEYVADRSDKIVGYRPGGGLLTRTQRLKAIHVRAQNQLVRRYTLNHETINGSLFLTSIDEHAGPTAAARRLPTTFEYFDDELGFETGEDVSIPTSHNGSPIPEILPYGIVSKEGGAAPDRLTTLNVTTNVRLVQPIPGGVELALNVVPEAGPFMSSLVRLINDLGTTAEADYIYRARTFNFPTTTANYFGVSPECNGGESAPFQQLLYNPSSGQEMIHLSCRRTDPTGRDCWIEGPTGRIPGDWKCDFLEDPPPRGTRPQKIVHYRRTWFVDVDGDGIQDQLRCFADETNLGYKFSRGYSAESPTVPTEPVDFDNHLPAFGSLCKVECTDTNDPDCNERRPVSMVLDVDGDGTGNLVVYDDGLGRWAGLEFVQGVPQWREDWFSNVSFKPRKYETIVLDSNGDGLRDVLALPDPDYFDDDSAINRPPTLLLLNNGQGFVEQRLVPIQGETEAPKYPAAVIDYDHDGIEELIEPQASFVVAGSQHTPWRIRKIRDGRIETAEVPSLPAGPGVFGDFDGDGDLDVLTRSRTHFPPFSFERLPFKRHLGRDHRYGLLKSATDGLGRRVTVDDYVRTARNSERLCIWPHRCTGKLEVAAVKQHTESHLHNNVRLDSTIHAYGYDGALADMAGYGWLGFRERTITVTDSLGGELSQTVLTYKNPTRWTPNETFTPYTYATAGRLESITTRLPSVEEEDDFTTDGSRTTYTTLVWEEGTSDAGRPFGYLATRRTETGVDFGVGGSSLADRLETFTPDVFGNITNENVISRDLLGPNNPVPLSETVANVTRHFEITEADVNDWLISLPKQIFVSSTPRCSSPQECTAKTKIRHTSIEYYPETTLPRKIDRELGMVELDRSTELIRDEFGNVREITASEATTGALRRTSINYDERALFPISTNAIGEGKVLTTQVRYDDRFGTVVAEADPNGIDSTWSYDEFGVLRRYRGPSGEHHVDYVAMTPYTTISGFPISAAYGVTSSEVGGETTEEHYNGLGQLVRRSSSGFNGVRVYEEFNYNYRQLLINQSRPHLDGNLSEGSVEYSYDAQNRLKLETYPDGGEVQYAYAVVGTNTAWAVPGAVDAVRARVKVSGTQQNDTIQVTDRDGLPVNVVDALNQSTRYFYAAFGNIERIVDPAGRAIDFTHDAYGRPKTVTDQARGGTEVTVYNGHDEIIETRDAAQRIRSLHYDDFGRPTELVDPDGTTSWTYDGTGPNEIGRLIETTSPTEQIKTYAYEPPTATQNRGLMNRVTQRLRAAAGAPVRELTTSYTFNQVPRLERIDYPSSSGTTFSVNYEFDTVGHPVGATDSLGNVHWRVLETQQGYRISRERVGSAPCGSSQGTTTVRDYHPLSGRLSGIRTTCGSNVLQDMAYDYDLAGNMTLRTDLVAGGAEEFGYDALNRLTTINGTTHYTYDSAQGRLHSQLGVGTYTYKTAGRDWLASAGGYTYDEHDAVGNVTKRSGTLVPGDTQDIEYTAFDLPSRITSGGTGGPTTDFSYDADGQRVLKRTENAATFYAGSLYQRTDNVGGTTDDRFMIYAGGRAVAQATSVAGGTPAFSYLHEDALGSVQTITSANGTVQQTRDYGPFGALRGATPPSTNVSYGYTGHEEDADLGLVNMQGRIYDQAIGQFMQADPIIAEPASQGLNRYAYVNNSPMNFVDPSGFASCALGMDCEAVGPTFVAAAGIAGVSAVGIAAYNPAQGGAVGGGLVVVEPPVGPGGGAGSLGSHGAAQANSVPTAEAGGFGLSVVESVIDLASASKSGPPPKVETPKGSLSSTSSAAATPGYGKNPDPIAPTVHEGIGIPPVFDPRYAPRPPDVGAPIPPMTDVYIGYTGAGLACNSTVCAHHTFIILRQVGEGTFATRAGPGGGWPKYGPMQTARGPWNERFPDKPSETFHQQRVGTVRRSLAELKQHVRAFNDAVDKARVPYSPSGPNSNTYTGEFLRSVGIEASPDRWAPGFSDSFDTSLPSMVAPRGWVSP